MQFRKLILLLLCVLLVSGPSIVFAFGGRSENVENRTPVSFRALKDGWESVNSFGKFAADHNPLREWAIRVDARIDQSVFNEDPAFGGQVNPRVIEGSGGVLFLSDAIDNACAPHDSPENSATQLSKLAKKILQIGKKPLIMVAPDKSSLHSDLLPFSRIDRPCFMEYIDQLNASLLAREIPGFIDLTSLLSSEIKRSREFLYLKKDSHWDSAGSLVAVNAAVDYLNPGLRKKKDIHFEGLIEYTGDLTRMRGLPEVDRAPIYSVDRGGEIAVISNEAFPGYESELNRRLIQSSSNLSLIKGKTLFLCDSYGLAALPQITPYFEDITVFLLSNFDAVVVKDLIEKANTVWIMTVERGVSWRLKNEIGSDEFINSLGDGS